MSATNAIARDENIRNLPRQRGGTPMGTPARLSAEIPDIFIPPTPIGNAGVRRGRNENSGMTTGGGDWFTGKPLGNDGKLILSPFRLSSQPPNPPLPRLAPRRKQNNPPPLRRKAEGQSQIRPRQSNGALRPLNNPQRIGVVQKLIHPRLPPLAGGETVKIQMMRNNAGARTISLRQRKSRTGNRRGLPQRAQQSAGPMRLPRPEFAGKKNNPRLPHPPRNIGRQTGDRIRIRRVNGDGRVGGSAMINCEHNPILTQNDGECQPPPSSVVPKRRFLSSFRNFHSARL